MCVCVEVVVVYYFIVHFLAGRAGVAVDNLLCLYIVDFLVRDF